MSGPERWLPGPLDLLDAPQRAALAVLHTAARAAQRALVAAHMELWDAQDKLYAYDPTPDVCAADAIVTCVDALIHAIERYEQARRTKERTGHHAVDVRDHDPRWPSTS